MHCPKFNKKKNEMHKTKTKITYHQKIKVSIGPASEILRFWGFPGGAVVKNPPANAGDTGSSPGPRRSHMPQSN